MFTPALPNWQQQTFMCTFFRQTPLSSFLLRRKEVTAAETICLNLHEKWRDVFDVTDACWDWAYKPMNFLCPNWFVMLQPEVRMRDLGMMKWTRQVVQVKTRTPHDTHIGYTTLRSIHITCFSAKLTKALVSSGRCINRTQTLTLGGFSEPSALWPWFKTRIRRNFMNRICKHLWGQIWLVASFLPLKHLLNKCNYSITVSIPKADYWAAQRNKQSWFSLFQRV